MDIQPQKQHTNPLFCFSNREEKLLLHSVARPANRLLWYGVNTLAPQHGLSVWMHLSIPWPSVCKKWEVLCWNLSANPSSYQPFSKCGPQHHQPCPENEEYSMTSGLTCNAVGGYPLGAEPSITQPLYPPLINPSLPSFTLSTPPSLNELCCMHGNTLHWSSDVLRSAVIDWLRW